MGFSLTKIILIIKLNIIKLNFKKFLSQDKVFQVHHSNKMIKQRLISKLKNLNYKILMKFFKKSKLKQIIKLSKVSTANIQNTNLW